MDNVPLRPKTDLPSNSSRGELNRPTAAAPIKPATGAGKIALRIIKCSDLPVMDILYSDPYVRLFVGRDEAKTAYIPRDLNPFFWADFQFNIPDITKPVPFRLSVWDHNTLSTDEPCGVMEDIILNGPVTMGPQEKSLSRPQFGTKGSVTFELYYKALPAFTPSKVQATIFNHHLTSVVRKSSEAFPVYRIQLKEVPEIFGGIKYGWNQKYDAAIKIFTSSTVQTAVQLQHSHLYGGLSKTHLTLKSGDDFLDMISFGVTFRKIRFFTYCML